MHETLVDALLQWLERPALCTFTETALKVKITASEGEFSLIADHSGMIHALLPPNSLVNEKSIISIESFTLCMHQVPSSRYKKSDPFFLLKVHKFHSDSNSNKQSQCLQLKPSTQPLHQDTKVKAAREAFKAQYNKQDLFLLLEKVLYTFYTNVLVAL